MARAPMKRHHTAARRLAAALLLAAACAPALAELRVPVGFQHTAWNQENGMPAGVIGMAQTTDGWLWLSTNRGLYRFDGVSFEHVAPPGQPALAHRGVNETHAAPNGDLYVSFFPNQIGVLRRDGSFELLPQPEEPRHTLPVAMALDRDGVLWAIGHGLRRYAQGRWTTVESDPAWSSAPPYSILVDQDDRLWAANGKGVWQLDRKLGRFARVSDQAGGLAQSPDGAVWVLARGGGPYLRLASSASGKPRRADANPTESRMAGQFDAAGTLWALDCPGTACLVRNAAQRGTRLAAARDADASLNDPDTAPGREDPVILEDREGNVWLLERGTLHRYRPSRFLRAAFDRDGSVYSFALDGKGDTWVAESDSGKLWRLPPDGKPVAQSGQPAYMVAPGRDGALLLGDKRSIRSLRDGAVETIALPPGPDGKPADLHMLGVLDDGKLLWTATLETGAIGWTGDGWTSSRALGLPPNIYLSQSGGAGRLWLATTDGKLVLHGRGKPTGYDSTAAGIATGIFPGDPLVLSGDNGTAILKDGRFQPLSAAEPEVLRGVSGLVVTADGDRWLNGTAGVVHVRAQDWQRAVARPDDALRYELFGPLDGYPGRANVVARQHTALSGDGRHIWFLATGGIVGLDSANLPRNTVAPQPRILDFSTDAGSFEARPDLRLPPGSANFRVRYTAPALRAPERVRFEYRLDGVDARWQDAGTRRMTSYTNVAPGDYVFQVRAINEDGVASTAPATLRFSVAPTFVQSLPFRIGAGIALALLLAMLYRLRVRYLTTRLTERLTERLHVRQDERERIARTLHDTILQAVQVLMLRLATLAGALPAGDRMRQQMEGMLRDANRAIGEGRDQVHELRTEAPALDNMIRTAAAALQPLYPDVAFELAVDGAARNLHPALTDEVGQIASEALRNAFTHAQARHIAVRVEYGRRELVVEVRDDGRGLDTDVARAGYRSGHWGLIGMRERAARIGARLDVASETGQGTTVTLSVPAARAYAEGPA
jgi:signal transduction histidine kinase/ligand-binding sensor domain-containing protein